MKYSTILFRTFLAALFALGLAACEQEGPAENAGEKIDEATENVKDAVEDAVNKVGDTVEDVGDKIEEQTDKVN
ncbi:MAG: hypothetical protein DHS20C01_09110 [marine bacterium B5-7]|nr:MAG: hypothetical protein DHS20C01_09110 [marine bacterium B5-7]